MKIAKGLKIILLVLGIPLFILGSWRGLDPIGFFAFSGMELLNDPSLLNEARGAGGVVSFSGILIILGAFLPRMTYTSNILAIVIFMGFAFARILGVGLDGMPNDDIVQGIVSELMFGSIGIFAFWKYQRE